MVLRAPTSASPGLLFSPLLPLAPSVLRLPLCCPGLFLPGARRRPSARSRALVTTSRRAAPGAPAQRIGRPGTGAARGGAGKPISCSQSCTTTKGPGRAGGRQGSDRSAGAGPAAATSAPAAPLGSQPAGDGKPAPLPRDPPGPLLTSRITEPAPVGRALPVASVLISLIAGTWGVLDTAVGSKYFISDRRDRPVRPQLCLFKQRKLGGTTKLILGPHS